MELQCSMQWIGFGSNRGVGCGLNGVIGYELQLGSDNQIGLGQRQRY
jgi:hypothetical protein